MRSPTHLAVAVTISLLIVELSAGKQHLSATVAAEVDTFGNMEAIQASTVMNLLAEQYTPKCLRAVILPEEGNKTNSLSNSGTNTSPENTRLSQQVSPYAKYSVENIVMDQEETDVKIILTWKVSHQNHETLKYIKKYTARVIPYSCITYVMPEPPDSQLLLLLTDASSNKLTQYFLVQAKNTTGAEHFLLDQRLGKEQNMAAIIPHTNQNSTYWRVLIRQLWHPSGSPKVFNVNKWSSATGLANSNDIFPDQTANFHRTKLIVSALQYRPLVDYEVVEGSRVVIPKPSIDINTLDAIAYKLNFTYDIVMPADGLWGVLKNDGHWTGIMGDVQFGRANFSLALALTQERANSLDPTKMYIMDALSFITAKSPLSAPWQKLITPFQLKVWVCVVVSVCCGVLLYHVVCHIQATISPRLLDSQAFMNIVASFLSQSLYDYLWLSAGRVFLGFWFLYAFLVTTHYKTSLTSNLAVPFIPPPLDTLQQLLGSNLKYGVIDIKGSIHHLFSTSHIPLYQRLWRDMHFHSDENSMRMVVEGTYSYISYRTSLVIQMLMHNSNPRRKTDLYVATKEFFPTGFVWYLPKDAPYLKNFNAVIWRFVEGGLSNKWLRDLHDVYVKEYLDQKSSQEQEDTAVEKDTRLVVFTLNHLQGAFFLFFIGHGCGLLLLFLELLLAPHTSSP